MAKLQEIINLFEKIAPTAYQESYDNTGLLVGDPNQEISRVMVSLDCTEQVVEDAIEKNCQLIVSHHPLIFKGLKNITTKNDLGKTLTKAIKNDIAIFASHTNLDKVAGGVNFKIAEKLGLKEVKILAPEPNQLVKLVVFVPKDHTEQVLKGMFEAGAGEIGNYSECSFLVSGTGTFKPNLAANPTIGMANASTSVAEDRIELMFPAHLSNQVIRAMKAAHPYEEVAFYLQKLENQNQEMGLGAIGKFESPISEEELIAKVKKEFKVPFLKHTTKRNLTISSMAVCGGTGSSLVNHAMAQKADAYLTADTKYHEFFVADKNIFYLDIGHFESEQFTVEIFSDVLSKSFPNIAVILTEIVTNPVNYA